MKRRLSRGYALQLLFQYDFTHQDTSELIEEFWKDKKADKAVFDFANEIFRGTVDNIKQIDKTIKDTAEHWEIPIADDTSLEVLSAIGKTPTEEGGIEWYKSFHKLKIPPMIHFKTANVRISAWVTIPVCTQSLYVLRFRKRSPWLI